MTQKIPPTFLCISCYFKGEEFLRAIKQCGARVFLLTVKKIEHEAWPRESIDEMFFMESDENSASNFEVLASGLAWLMRKVKIDRIVALDDFDVEKAAYLRECFRIPGMGQTTARYFRDKLAMRVQAASMGIPVPAFTPLFNDDDIKAYVQNVKAPWLIKPRAEASATGITKINNEEELWHIINTKLENKRHNYLLEQFRPGSVFHVDALTVNGNTVFSRVSEYLNTPMEVAHGGGIFRSVSLDMGSKDDKAFKKINDKVMDAFGMQFSASHTEYIKCHEDGKIYFLETASRVGGAHLAEMVEAASGINLWGEWARIEYAMATNTEYKLPEDLKQYGGVIISLARQERPDLTFFNDREIYWKMTKKHHVGIIVRSEVRKQILDLLDKYSRHIMEHHHASAPVPERPTS